MNDLAQEAVEAAWNDARRRRRWTPCISVVAGVLIAHGGFSLFDGAGLRAVAFLALGLVLAGVMAVLLSEAVYLWLFEHARVRRLTALYAVHPELIRSTWP